MNLIPQQLEDATDRRVVIPLVDWETYEKFLDALGERRIFATYDGVSLELMFPSPIHEVWRYLLSRFISILAEELNIPYRAYGMTTWRRRQLKRGLEADDCFYFRSVKAILGKLDIDLRIDPPPDLAVEIEVSRSSLDRQGIYADLGVPEIWRFDGDKVHVCSLQPNHEYEELPNSPTFSGLDMNRVPDLIQQDPNEDNLALYRRWRLWIRKNVVPAGKSKRTGSSRRQKKPKG